MKKTVYSDSFKVFLGLCSLLILLSLFLANGYATVWNGAEANLLLTAQEGAADNLVEHFVQFFYKGAGLSVFTLRLPSILLLLGAAAVFFFFGKKVFGRDAVVLTLLVSASSFVLLPYTKIISGDLYLFFTQVLHLVFTILFIKQPLSKWRIASSIFLGLGMLIHPLAMGLWGFVIALLLFAKHPNRENVKVLFFPIGLAILILPIIAQFVFGSWDFSAFTFSFGQLSIKETLAVLVIGMLPWLGFLPATLVDLVKKWRSNEELSIIIMAWLVAALVSQSVSIVLVFSFMIVKQVWVVLRPGYPYLRLVKGFALLNLISIFIIVFLALLSGISWVGEVGYKPLLLAVFVYWVLSFLGVLGLFLKDRRVVIAGTVFSGLFPMLIFWWAIYPKWEAYRQLPQQIIEEARDKNASGVEKLTMYSAPWMTDNFMVYTNEVFSEFEVSSDSIVFKQQLKNPNHQIFVFDNEVLTEIDSIYLKRGEYLDIKGGWGRMGSGAFIIGE
ncbi:MAG: glycosyltransferase family 39 protein [Saprospiraceae bacterium]